MASSVLCLLSLSFCVALGSGRQGRGSFAPGWNGEARTPPLGWRSWNAFGAEIDQPLMVEAVDALTAKNRTVWGRSNVSLCDLGYCSVGVDEGWELCERDQQGRPLPDTTRFPDLEALVSYGHSRALHMGWYLNGCKCKEHDATQRTYQGDITALFQYGFDGVKLDDCGPHKNFTLYAELMRASGRNFTVEVHNPSAGSCQGDNSTCPTQNWCPFNWYRTSHDITTDSMSWLKNLQSVIPFQNEDHPCSQPGCWAYPDMLEVGRVAEPMADSFFTWNRAHFGAWCVTSSPLILGLELSDKLLEPVLQIIGNAEAIMVNQQWAGHPGTFILEADVKGGTLQLWAKAQLHGAIAALVINNSSNIVDFDVLASLNITGSPSVRDIWNQKDIEDNGFSAARVPAYDSAFLRITPRDGQPLYV